MSEQRKNPSYMAQLLEKLGWDQGIRIPLANPGNQELETILINRQNEIQQLKESFILQQQKREDLNKYKEFVHSEYQENTRLLFAHKQQLEQEVKLRQLACSETDGLDRGVIDCQKQCKDIGTRVDRLQINIARLLKKADTLKSEVCGERGALQEWRAALERNSGDITAIEQFTRQDLSKAKALENKRQKLKVEHDRMHERINQLVSNLNAEERACDRISIQVMEGMEQRKQMMIMWRGAVDNLRQRDTDIRHIREDYAVLEAEANKIAEQCREQQAFCDQQRGNNGDAQRDNLALAQRLSHTRLAQQQLAEQNATSDSEAQSLQRELANLRVVLEKLHMENRQIMDEQHRKDLAIQSINSKISDLKEKLTESLDKSKSSEKRAKELEDMLNEEERYASQLTANQQRAMHCSFVEQQKFLTLKNEEKLFHMHLKASKAILSKLETKQRNLLKTLQSQKESLYAICYQVETLGARVSHMEGAQAERECSAELMERENRLKDVCSRHAARVALLERHSARLHDDMRRLAKDLEAQSVEHVKLQSRLKTSVLNVEGGEKELREAREAWRRARVEDALLRLRGAHAARALAAADGAAYSLDRQRLQLHAAMNERLVEIRARQDMFNVQKRALFEDCGKLRSEIREREQRIEQLKKRYDIFIGSLGKDESGEQLSVTFFKIKMAAARAELRERGAALDADVRRRERDVAALEAALPLLHAAHAHFMRHLSPLDSDAPEIEELNDLSKKYYEMRDELKSLNARIADLEPSTAESGAQLTALIDKYNKLNNKLNEVEQDLEIGRERMRRQQDRLQTAREVVRQNANRARKLIDNETDWRVFQMSVWTRECTETCVRVVQAAAGAAARPPARARLAAGLRPLLHAAITPARLRRAIDRIISEPTSVAKESRLEIEGSVLSSSSESSRSGVSVASGYTRRLSAFRTSLAPRLREPALVDEIPEQARRSTVSLRVVTLGMEDSVAAVAPSPSSTRSQKSLR
ncbi:coiled-coil domain-containing protein 39 isoform X2 [Bombyx mori]|uniref:Coiled-coil domain-containing protein 39 n=1 Tax=Bombyx mori TaxID=7091 RepID=A0A8R2AL01_BOMMO|nr:coiled-coil domain-containing protein 39 isoform X3 [Bombyx mori]